MEGEATPKIDLRRADGGETDTVLVVILAGVVVASSSASSSSSIVLRSSEVVAMGVLAMGVEQEELG